MTWQKFEYFLNAVLYCLWLKQNKSQEFMQNAVSALLSWISRHLFSSAYSAKFDDYKAANLKIWDEYRNNPNGGWDFIIAHNLFDFLFACYPGLLSFVLAAIVIRYYDDFNLIVVIAFILPVMLAFILVDRAIFKKDRYLRYFHIFEKKDNAWHRKWSRITTAFCLGAVVMTVAGIAAMWAVWLW